MTRPAWIAAVLVALAVESPGFAGDGKSCEPAQPNWLHRWHPVGGWDPDGGGLLHWWNPHCFPRCGAPDDYCRKPLPCVCWPAYPCYYNWGSPELGFPVKHCSPTGPKSP
jgi:hypothetical protein